VCRQLKPPDDFYGDRHAASGYQASCKECVKNRASEWRRAHTEGHAAHVSAWKAAHAEAAARLDRRVRWRRNPATRAFARLVVRVASTVRRAVLSRRLVRPDRRSSCGRAGVAIDAVHERYEQPIEVIWLCRRCHYGWSLARRQGRRIGP
jgi:hypothetical protein